MKQLDAIDAGLLCLGLGAMSLGRCDTEEPPHFDICQTTDKTRSDLDCMMERKESGNVGFVILGDTYSLSGVYNENDTDCMAITLMEAPEAMVAEWVTCDKILTILPDGTNR